MKNPGEQLPGIQIRNKQRRHKIISPLVASFCAEVFKSFDLSNTAISIAFVSPHEMRLLNRQYLKHDYATDVLSFSYERLVVEGLPFLGEIIIAPEIAVIHANRYGVNPEKELRKLLVHGILHLLGYDHEADRGQMNRLQTKLLRRKQLVNFPPLAMMKETR
jgi:probable rRNA maturation factor